MRVVSGRLGGRIFSAPAGHRTHPMSERVRAALFNSLGDVYGLKILDAYAGTGALGFEAVSRGADQAVAIDKDLRAYKCLTDNIETLGLAEQVKAIRANVSTWSDLNPDEKFDIIFCDPPFDKLDVAVVEKLVRHLYGNGKSLMILSYSGRSQVPPVNGVVVVDNRSYGDAALATYRLK